MKPLKSQAGLIPIILLYVAIVGIIFYILIASVLPLANRRLSILHPKPVSKAATSPIVFKSSEGQVLPVNAANIPLTSSADVKIELTSTLGPPKPSSTPTPSPTPTPSDTTIDTLSYFLTDHLDKGLTGTHPLSQVVEGQKAYYVKWDNKTYEIYTWDDNYLYLKEDHSGSPVQYYSFNPGNWMKRQMSVGDKVSVQSNQIIRYDNSCNNTDQGAFPIELTLESHFPNYNIGGDLGGQDVIVLKYDSSLVDNNGVYEKFYFSKEWGLIKWEEYSKSTNILTNQSIFNKFNTPIQPDKTVSCTNPVLSVTADASDIGTTSPTSGESWTTSYRIAESSEELDNAQYEPYTQEPTVIDYTFDDVLGSKYIWVEFQDSENKTDRKAAQIELISDPSPTPTSSPEPSPTDEPTDEPIPTSSPTPTTTSKPTIKPTPKATPQARITSLPQSTFTTPTRSDQVIIPPQSLPSVSLEEVSPKTKECNILCQLGDFISNFNKILEQKMEQLLSRFGILK